MRTRDASCRAGLGSEKNYIYKRGSEVTKNSRSSFILSERWITLDNLWLSLDKPSEPLELTLFHNLALQLATTSFPES